MIHTMNSTRKAEKIPLLPVEVKNKISKSFLSSTFFTWLTPLMRLGSQKPLEFQDLLELDEEYKAEAIYEQFQHQWTRECDRNRKPRLAMSLAKSFYKPFLLAGILRAIRDALLFVSPMLIKHIIAFLSDPTAPISEGLMYVGIVLISGLVQSLCQRQYLYLCFVTGMNLRSAIVTSIYKKAMVISAEALQKSSTGEITNLISIDAQRMQDLTSDLHALWYAPYQVILACILLYQQIGNSFIAGVVMILLMIPITGKISKRMQTLQKRLMKVKDERINICCEVLSGIKVIKLQAWESSFAERVENYRLNELSKLRLYILTRAFSSSIFNSVPSFVTIASFSMYVYLGNSLDVGTALTSLALFNILRFPLFNLPYTINAVVEANVSLGRLTQFLTDKEIKQITSGPLTSNGISIQNATIGYEILNSDTTTPPTAPNTSNSTPSPTCTNNIILLKDITLNVTKQQLVAVVGAVGSGKSTLMNSILGNTSCFQGSIHCKGSIAYVSQQPFIQNETVQNNILFGLPYNESKYQNAIYASCLKDDFAILPGGDQTEIGEKGINLSGGQKTRVAIARAIYQDADIYLFDDVLSAVDNHVGTFIFNECLKKALKHKIIVFVTNGLTYLPFCDHIAIFQNQCIAEQGSYLELTGNNDGVLTNLIQSTLSSNSPTTSNATPGTPTASGSQNTTNTSLEEQEESNNKSIESTITVGFADSGVPKDESDVELEYEDVDENAIASEDIDDNEEKGEIRMRKLSRSLSIRSVQSSIASPTPSTKHSAKATTNSTNNAKSGQLIVEEERSFGDVPTAMYYQWINSSGGLFRVGLVALFFSSAQCVQLSATVWLSYWSEHSTENSQTYYLTIFMVLNLSFTVFAFLRIVSLYLFSLKGSKVIFKQLLTRILRMPMSFYDTTPLGRILNRLSKDIYAIDEVIPSTLSMYFVTTINLIATLFTIVYVTPLFAILIPPLSIGYYMFQRYFIRTSRELQRLESISRSPIYALFTETLDGLPTIRAMKSEQMYISKSNLKIDINQTAYHLNFAANWWLGLRLDVAGTVIVSFAAMLSILKHLEIDNAKDGIAYAGLVGVSLSYAFTITQMLNWSVRTTSQLQTQMVSMERIFEYVGKPVEEEISYSKSSSNSIVVVPNEPNIVGAEWPEHGEIRFINVTLQYRPQLPFVLNDLNVTIPKCSKVGVVGRTGAGKSSLVVAIMRLVELYRGQIVIDGINIAKLSLNLLRSAVSIIPQDPVLFLGTIRSNLDPFGLYHEMELHNVLKIIRVRGSSTASQSTSSETTTSTSSQALSLDMEVTEKGSNLSVGERQLLCIARAMLKKSKIIIMDEATASIDMETDQLIQLHMSKAFADATCLTIAHRIHTIINSDYILVMNEGKMVEFDSPQNLLQNETGFFTKLVQNEEQQ